MILSAKHGLVDPDQPLEPYDRALTDLPADARRTWGQQVVKALAEHFDGISGMTFEVHAGEPYRAAIEPGLRAAGAQLEVPLNGLPLGRQLAWYREHRLR
jgi:hypothetical protein